MINTKHMTVRMQHRSLPQGAVDLAIEIGEWNERGDRLSVGVDALDAYINTERRRLQVAERLRRRGGATVVLDGKDLITIYDRSRGARR